MEDVMDFYDVGKRELFKHECDPHSLTRTRTHKGGWFGLTPGHNNWNWIHSTSLKCVLLSASQSLMHYKKPVFFVMFKMTQETVQKNRDDVHKTPPKIRSTETCKKLGKNCTQHGQCLPWRARANIPVYGSCYPHVWKLTCPRLPTNISMLFTTSRSLWCSSTFLFRKCWCPVKRLRFLVTSQKTWVCYSDGSR